MEVVREEQVNAWKLLRFMHLFSVLKAFISSIFLILFYAVNFGQDSGAFIEEFRDSKVFYADLGMNTAPFNIRNPFPNSIEKISYKNNFKPILGIGFAYKWISLRVALPILGNIRPKAEYGETKQFNIGIDYTYKKTYLDLEFKGLTGYSIKDAASWDTSFNSMNPNALRPNLSAYNFSLNAWYFNNIHFKMNALQGKRAHFKQKVQTWYIKGTGNVFGIDHLNESIIPSPLQSSSNSKLQARNFSAMDIGLIPGFAYANRIKNWQFSGWVGLGGVIQGKFYTPVNGQATGFLGLAPRYDIRFIAGYSSDDYFIFFVTDFDNKSIRFNDLIYRQYYYSLKLTGGFRFDHPKKKRDKKQNPI
jgi:hypothetical protein